MPTVIYAVYQNGVFHRTTPPDLPDGAAVRLTVEPASANPATEALDPAAVHQRIREIAAKSRVSGTVETTARDHDQILYGDSEGFR
jgi:predicted DNA-binding antitoxin AbrB/MazE fold protein